MSMFKAAEQEHSTIIGKTIPAGFYRVVVTGVELAYAQNNSASSFFVFDFSVVEGDEEGAKVTDRITWTNQNETAIKIGHAKLADLMFTLQVSEFDSVTELVQATVGKELVIETIVEIEDERESTRILYYFSRGGKHRNEKLNQAIVLGPTDRKPFVKKGSKRGPATQAKQHNDKVPF